MKPENNITRMTKQDRLKAGLLKCGELAKAAGVLESHVAFYTRKGLIVVSSHTRGKFNLYGKDATLRRIAVIKELQKKGMNLDEIKMRVGGES